LQKELGTDLGTEYFLNPYDGYQMNTQANISASKDNLEFAPKITLEQGIKSYIPEIKRLYENEII
jgi:ADP-L-glycero-D-manno-heptose 6-epimerase